MFDCCNPKWKREQIVEHKFDYIDIDSFLEYNCSMNMSYFFQYLKVLRGLYMYVSDILVVVFLFTLNSVNPDQNVNVNLDGKDMKMAEIARYVYPFCVVLSLILLIFDIRKAIQIIKSKDISLAFTNTIAYRYLSFKNHSYFCLFSQINEMKTSKDQLALWVYFRMRDWKRLYFTEAPRIAIFFFIIVEYFKNNPWNPADYSTFGMRQVSIYALVLTVSLFAINVFAMTLAMLVYIPLIMDIRGNLKEYCCHKIDKRISELILLNVEDKKLAFEKVERTANHRTKHELLRPGPPKNGPAKNIRNSFLALYNKAPVISTREKSSSPSFQVASPAYRQPRNETDYNRLNNRNHSPNPVYENSRVPMRRDGYKNPGNPPIFNHQAPSAVNMRSLAYPNSPSSYDKGQSSPVRQITPRPVNGYASRPTKLMHQNLNRQFQNNARNPSIISNAESLMPVRVSPTQEILVIRRQEAHLMRNNNEPQPAVNRSPMKTAQRNLLEMQLINPGSKKAPSKLPASSSRQNQ